MSFLRFLIVPVIIIGVCLLLSYFLIKRRLTIIAILIGLVTIGVYQIYLHQALDASIQSCIEHACLSASLPPDCPEAQFGCTEWSGLSVFVFYVIGIVQSILFVIGTGVIAFVVARQRKGTGAQSHQP